MIGAGAEPDACSGTEQPKPSSGTDSAATPAVGTPPAIAADLDAWANDRRRRNLRNVPADRARLEAIVRGCGWSTLEQASPDSFLNFLSHMRRPVDADELAAARKARVKPRQPWTGATCNREQTRLSGLLEDAARRAPHRRLLNWARALPRADTDDAGEGSRAITWPEFLRLLDSVRVHAPRRLMVYLVMGYTGIRFDEARTLAIAEVKLEGSPRLMLTRRTKSKKRRTIPLHELAVPILRGLIAGRAEGRVFTTFPTLRTLKRDCRKAGIGDERIGYHSLRKCFGGRLALAGVPLTVAQKLLGHSDPKLTANIYTHFQDGELAREIARLGGATDLPSRSSPQNSEHNLTRAGALADTPDVQTDSTMAPTTHTTRFSVPGRAGDHRSLNNCPRGHARLGTDDRGRTEPSDPSAIGQEQKSHLRDLNPGPMLYESTGPEPTRPAEALARLFEGIARFLRSGAADDQSESNPL